MKTSKIIKAMALTLSLMLMMTGCMNVAAVRSRVVSLIDRDSDSYITEDVINEDSYAWDIINKAVSQYQNQDHTPSGEKVVHQILWLGYTKVIYENLDLRMDESGRELLENVVYNFEHVVEDISEHNVDIQIDLYFIDEERVLTYDEENNFFYLDHETVVQDIHKYNSDNSYDSVITTVQSGGEENCYRNCNEDMYFNTPVVLGLNTMSISGVSYGYSTFDLCDPCAQVMFEDPTVPSLESTAVAVHEWMHQFEEIGYLLEIEFPNTHAYMGGEEYPGYKTYEFAPEGNYDYFEFYAQVLSGTVPYTDFDGNVMYVGMYPEMWKMTTVEFWSDYGQSVYAM